MAVDKPILLEYDKMKKFQIMGLEFQTLAGEKEGLETLEIWRVILPPGSESPVNQHYGEVAVITMKGAGRVQVGEDSIDLFPHTTLIVPPNIDRQYFNTGEEDLELLAIRSMARPPEKTFMEILGSRL